MPCRRPAISMQHGKTCTQLASSPVAHVSTVNQSRLSANPPGLSAVNMLCRSRYMTSVLRKPCGQRSQGTQKPSLTAVMLLITTSCWLHVLMMVQSGCGTQHQAAVSSRWNCLLVLGTLMARTTKVGKADSSRQQQSSGRSAVCGVLVQAALRSGRLE